MRYVAQCFTRASLHPNYAAAKQLLLKLKQPPVQMWARDINLCKKKHLVIATNTDKRFGIKGIIFI